MCRAKFRVSDRGLVFEVRIRESTAIESIVHDVDGSRPYVMWGGRRRYLTPGAAAKARIAYAEHRSRMRQEAGNTGSSHCQMYT